MHICYWLAAYKRNFVCIELSSVDEIFRVCPLWRPASSDGFSIHSPCWEAHSLRYQARFLTDIPFILAKVMYFETHAADWQGIPLHVCLRWTCVHGNLRSDWAVPLSDILHQNTCQLELLSWTQMRHPVLLCYILCPLKTNALTFYPGVLLCSWHTSHVKCGMWAFRSHMTTLQALGRWFSFDFAIHNLNCTKLPSYLLLHVHRYLKWTVSLHV